MRIALIDLDNDLKDTRKVFPNLPLMKLSAWHKSKGDEVEWYDPLVASYMTPYDICYVVKVFSFTKDYEYEINANKVIRGGVWFCNISC